MQIKEEVVKGGQRQSLVNNKKRFIADLKSGFCQRSVQEDHSQQQLSRDGSCFTELCHAIPTENDEPRSLDSITNKPHVIANLEPVASNHGKQ